jgi:hypothetical protein
MAKYEAHRFEAHITLDKEYGPRLREGLKGWQYSAIDDDPIMGQKPYCYLTAYDPDPEDLFERMLVVEDILVYEMDIPVLRKKIERIIYDSKTGVDELLTQSE